MNFENEKLIHSVINNKFKNCKYFEYDELFSLGWIALKRAEENFKPEYGTKFSAYAYKSIELYLMTSLMKEYRKREETKHLSLDYEYNNDNDDCLDLKCNVPDTEMTAEELMMEQCEVGILVRLTREKIISGTKKGVKRNNLLTLLDIYENRITNGLSCKAVDVYNSHYKDKFSNKRFYQIRKEISVYFERAVKEIKKKGLY